MATNTVVMEAQKLKSPVMAVDAETSVPVKIIQVPAKCGPITTQSTSTAAGVSVPSIIIPTAQCHQLTSSTGVPRFHTSAPVMVKAMVATPGVGSANSQVTKPVLNQSMNQGTVPRRKVMITVPRTTTPQPVSMTSRIMQNTSPQVPANIQVPPGMMLIRSDSGQLMLVSQQALAQAQRGQRDISDQVSRIRSPQVCVAAGNKSKEKVTVMRLAAPPRFQPAAGQRTTIVKVTGLAPKPAVVQTLGAMSEQGRQSVTHAVGETKIGPSAKYTQETLESVRKCKNFLITLIKLASNDSRSAHMANNVRGLVRSLLEGKLEAEEFTQQLYHELKSTPQPCLVPFLKKSLPVVRCLTEDPKLFIQQASTSTRKLSNTDADQNREIRHQVIQQPQGATPNTGLTLDQSRNYTSKNSRSTHKHTVLYSGIHFTGTFSKKNSFSQDPSQFASKANPASYKEDDDINDVASMAGVNLREEKAQILTSIVGSVVQSCQDQLFLSPNPVLCRIIIAGQALGVTDVGPEVVALVSHATQGWLHSLLAKLSAMATDSKAVLKEDMGYDKVSDVHTQIRFLVEVESLKEKRQNKEERKRLLHFSTICSKTEDPQQQQLKERAKELQKIEEAQLQQRQANLTALAAIGPRRKRQLEQTEIQVSLLPRQGVRRVSRVVLRDLLMVMEQEPFLRHSHTLYKAML